MNFKHSYKYRLYANKKGIMIFYLVVAVLLTINTLLQVVMIDDGNSSFFNGVEAASIIYLFVSGLNSFKEEFYMLLQNGVSRKTVFLSIFTTVFTISAFMALIDTLLVLIISKVANYGMLFSMIYGNFLKNPATYTSIYEVFTSFIWFAGAYSLAFSIGLVITLFYYKANAAVKLIVSIGIPGILIILLPILDTIFFNDRIFSYVATFFLRLIGFSEHSMPNPWIGVLSFFGIAAVIQGVNWLMMRKASVKV